MLFVETNNFRQQDSLSQDFVREGNLFAIPFSKSTQIGVIVKNILFQIFQLEGSQKKTLKNKCRGDSLQLAMKITAFISNLLKLKFSLSAIRQIFQSIKVENNKLSMYEQYFNQMNEQFCEFNQNQCISNRNIKFIPTKDQQQNQFLKKDLSITLHLDLEEFQHQNQKTIKETSKKNTISFSDKILTEVQNSQIRHTLQSQIYKTPHSTVTRLQQLNECICSETGNYDKSFQSQNCANHLQDEVLTNNSLRSSNYCSSFKIESLKNLLHNESFPSAQPAQMKKDLNKSKYIQDLQGLLNPIPSFLHDEGSLREMICKQKKQDIRKSKIIKQQIIKNELKSQVTTSTNDKIHLSSYRSIKLNNKLRRSSKKNQAKKDIQELNNHIANDSKLPKQKTNLAQIPDKYQYFFQFYQRQMGEDMIKNKVSDQNKEKVKIYCFNKIKKG